MKEKLLVHVGTFGKPQGLKGDIRVNILISSLEVFKKLKQFFLKGENYDLVFEKYKKIGKNNIVTLKGCNDRNSASSFNGKKIYTYKDNLPKINDDKYYVLDLMGCKVININKIFMGNVVDIKNFGAGDLVEIINKEKKLFYIPMNKENIVSVDLDNKTIIIDPIKGLFD